MHQRELYCRLLSYICTVKGRVLKSTGSWFLTEDEQGKIISCRIRGQLRLRDIGSTNPIAVGDFVHFELQEDGTGTILEIEDRKNYIIRKSVNLSKQTHIIAANIRTIITIDTPQMIVVLFNFSMFIIVAT